MNISKKSAAILNKFKKVWGVYLKALLVILGVAGALFVGREFDARAAEPSRVNKTLHLDYKTTENACLGLNSCPAYLWVKYYKPDDWSVWEANICELDGEISDNGGNKDISFKKDCTVSVPGDGWEVYSCEIRQRDNTWLEAQISHNGSAVQTYDHFSLRIAPGSSSATINETGSVLDISGESGIGSFRHVVYRTLKTKIMYEGRDITNYYDISGYNLPKGTSSGNNFWLEIQELKIKKKDNAPSNIPDFNANNYCLSQGGRSFSCYGEDNNVSINGYDGSDLVFSDVKVVYFTSEIAGSSGQSDISQENEYLAQHYTLTSQTDLNGIHGSVSNSDDFNKGAWKLVYAAGNVTQDFDLSFECEAGVYHEFASASVSSASSGVTVKGGASAPALSGDNKKVTFSINVKKTASKQETVKIGEKKYTDYINTFSYGVSGIKLTDLIERIKYNSSANTWSDIGTWNTESGTGSDVYTIADQYRVPSWGQFKGKYRLTAKPGYYVGDATVKVNDTSVVKNLDDEFTVETAVQNNSIAINDIKKHYDVKLKGANGLDTNSLKIRRNGDELNWNTSITDNLDLNGPFTLDLSFNDGRKVFIENDEEIANRIKAANPNSGLEGLRCRKNNDTSITLTIPHRASNDVCEVNIPANLFEWKKSNVNFSIDCRDLVDDDIYGDETLKGIKLYNGNTANPEKLIELKKSNSSTLVNVNTLENVPYSELEYTLCIEGISYADLSGAAVSLEGGSAAGEVVTDGSGNTSIKFTFRLDPNCANASYRSSVKFQISGIESTLKEATIDLCPKAILYFVSKDGTTRHVDTAPNDSRKKIPVKIPPRNDAMGDSGGADYIVHYPDYSKLFNESKIIRSGSCVENVRLDGFNRVFFHINPDATDLSVLCADPDEPAPPVRFTPVEGVKYYNVNDAKEIDYQSPIQGTISIKNGEEFSFAVQCNEGYDASTLVLQANDKTFGSDVDFTKSDPKQDENGNTYYVFTISENAAKYPITISGNVRALQLQVRFVTDLVDGDGNNLGKCGYIYNGAAVNGTVTVLYGQGIAFEVTLPGECNQSDITVTFYDENNNKVEDLNQVNGRYILNNITIDRGYIKVSGAKKNEYPITFVSNAKAKYQNKDGSALNESTKYVSHGGSFEFRVQPNTGYTMGQDSVVYVRYADGHSESLQNPSDGVYKISNITQACTVSVENVEDIVYTITLVPADGVTYLNDVDNVIKDVSKIKHGRNFEFAISLSDEYDDSFNGMNIIVNDGKSSKSSAQKLASGRYVIPNVSEDITIKVGNVRKNTYTVTLTGAEGIDYYDSSGRVITGDNQVEDHADFSFKVDLYPAYVGSDITVMLGDTPMNRDGNGFYTISKITESKTVTVVGIEMNDSSELTSKINNLPDNLGDLGDVDDVIEATKAYEALSDAEKALVGNADKLKALQEQVKAFHHVSNGVSVSGVDWYIKLCAIPITDDTDACGRIYKKLGSEYILSLYNVYLWNTLTDSRYTLPEGQRAVITLPTPDMSYFEKPTAIHEKDSGKLEFINASINNETTTFETDSFSPMGIVANRSSTPGRSSLLDAADANLDAISNFAASLFGNDANRVTRSGSLDGDNNNGLGGDSGEGDDASGNIDEKFKSRNNKVTATSSALRLILVLMILILIGLMIYLFMKRKKDKEGTNKK